MRKKPIKLSRCAFLLSGSALGGWGSGGEGGLLSGDWAAELCFVVIRRLLSVLESGGVLSVLEHLHAGLNQGEVPMCFEEPSQSHGLFSPSRADPLYAFFGSES